MLVIKLSVLLDRGALIHLLPCQEMLRKGLLVSFDSAKHTFVIFVSHQWLGFTHPDPTGLQFEALRACLEQLVAGHTVAEEWSDALLFGSDEANSHIALEPDSTYVWLDWLCIPQIGKGLLVPQLGQLCSGEPYDEAFPSMSSSPIFSWFLRPLSSMRKEPG
jgi:hypothetical protein